MSHFELHNGDCIKKMRAMADNSVHAVCTDAPYNLASITKRFGGENSAPPKGEGAAQRMVRGFRKSKWDTDIAFKPEIWKECLRVLKPGGLLLAFGACRNYHKMACAIDDAGFTVMNMLQWGYASGFPKGRHLGVDVDKIRGNEREIIGKHSDHASASNMGFPNNALGKPQEEKYGDITRGYSEWEGWYVPTALKPAYEPICMAQKPISEGTFADNLLKHGTGGINMDGCDVEGDEPYKINRHDDNAHPFGNAAGKDYTPAAATDRKMANLIHDGSPEILESMEGIGKFFYCAKPSVAEKEDGVSGGSKEFIDGKWEIIKANTHPTVKPIALMRVLTRLITPQGGIVLDPFMGSGTTGIAAVMEGLQFIGIEGEEDFCRIAKERIKHWTTTPLGL